MNSQQNTNNTHLLDICIPTYNRASVVCRDIERYLTVKDSRFCVSVSDNCSQDDTVESLLKIDNQRLSVQKNSKNIGFIRNAMKVLLSSSASYALLLLDKDTLIEQNLKIFFDYLDSHHPDFGYVNISTTEGFRVETSSAGIESILACGYSPRHPSGYFWKTDILKQNYRATDVDNDFVFAFEIFNPRIAESNSFSCVYMPLIIDANRRTNICNEHSYTYTNKNYWFSFDNCINQMKTFLLGIYNLNIQEQQKQEVYIKLVKQTLYDVTIRLHVWLNSPDICNYHNIKMRDVGIREMYRNALKVFLTAKKYITEYSPPLSIYLIYLYKIPKFYIRELLNVKQIAYRSA